MDAVKRENRVLRVAAVVLLCALAADVGTSGQQSQRLPGPGTGIVDVVVVNEPGITQRGEWKVGQQGEWRMAQQGDWRVDVSGTVVAIPSMPNLVTVNRTYTIYWDHTNAERVTVREIHPGGWVRVEIGKTVRWINLTRAVSIAGPS
jgi:hypothetical protein